MEYSIGALSTLTGVSRRTLRYYDEIGLLCPRRVGEGGYRFYGETEVALLQQILFYRERGFSLERIGSIVYDQGFDILRALLDHLETLEDQRKRLERLIATVEKTISEKRGEGTMKDEEKFKVFKEEMLAEHERQYGAEAREKYGKEAVAAAQGAIQAMTGEGFAAFEMLGQEILEKLRAAVREGQSPESQVGHEIAKLHQAWITMSWGREPAQAHEGLVEMYLMDGRFTQYYDSEVAGCAKFLRDAVVHWLA